MGKIKSTYATRFKNELHTMPNNKPKRHREPKDINDIRNNVDNIYFTIHLNGFHMIAIILAAFAPIGIGWKLGILGCMLMSGLNTTIEEEED